MDSETARAGRFTLELRTCGGQWEGHFDGPVVTGAYDDIEKARKALIRNARKRLVDALNEFLEPTQ